MDEKFDLFDLGSVASETHAPATTGDFDSGSGANTAFA
jgi:hypothetical protein